MNNKLRYLLRFFIVKIKILTLEHKYSSLIETLVLFPSLYRTDFLVLEMSSINRKIERYEDFLKK